MKTISYYKIKKREDSANKKNSLFFGNNKKASSDTLVLEATIFIVLNLVFFAVMLYFVYSAGERVFVYEQSYAKQIALLIDNAKPRMAISLDMSKAVELAKKNNLNGNEIIKINSNENSVQVNLKKGGGYSYNFFSDYNIKTEIKEGFLIIIIENRS